MFVDGLRLLHCRQTVSNQRACYQQWAESARGLYHSKCTCQVQNSHKTSHLREVDRSLFLWEILLVVQCLSPYSPFFSSSSNSSRIESICDCMSAIDIRSASSLFAASAKSPATIRCWTSFGNSMR